MKKLYTFTGLVWGIMMCTLSGHAQQVLQLDHQYPVYEGSTEIQDVFSPSLEGNLQGNPSTQPVKVYLPPGYEGYPNNRYPVIYLLHRYTVDYNDYYKYYNLLERLNHLISNRTIAPMIVVTPNGSTVYKGSMFSNSYVSGNWEDYIVRDVTTFIGSMYRLLDQPGSRGLSGFSMGGYGSVAIGMKYPSVFGSVASIGAASLDLQATVAQDEGVNIEVIAAASKQNSYNPDDPWYTRAACACAVAWAPDSTALPVLGRFPYDSAGIRIDSTWQKWLEHDPISLIPAFKDSLLMLDTLQLYIGKFDKVYLPPHDSFHQALLDQGIDHGYRFFTGEHNPDPVLNDMFILFSEKLKRAVPKVSVAGDFCLERSDTLAVVSDRDGKIYIVPRSDSLNADSIQHNHVFVTDVTAGQQAEILLSGFEEGTYQVFAESNDGMISNIPDEFWVVSYNPTMAIHVSDYHTGHPIADCELDIGGSTYITDDEGIVLLQACGAVNQYPLKIDHPNYGSVDATLLLFSDTTYNITLVHDLYLKVVDRVTQLPLTWASVFIENQTLRPNDDGLVTIQNLREARLIYRVECRYYITVEDTCDIVPGDTLKVELTPRLAKVEFLVSDETGPVRDQTVSFGDSRSKTDKDGVAAFSSNLALNMYHFSIERPCYYQVSDSLFLEIDTTVHVTLEPDTTLPVFTVARSGDTLQISSSSAGELYLVVPGTERHIDSIRVNPCLTVPINSDDTLYVNTADLTIGEYWIYIVDQCDNISYKEPFGVRKEEITALGNSIYPNPVDDVLIIEPHVCGEYTVDIVTVTGRIIQSRTFTGSSQSLDLSSFQKGIYFIAIRSKDLVTTRKIIKL